MIGQNAVADFEGEALTIEWAKRQRFARAMTLAALAVSCLAIAAHGQSATPETCPGPAEQSIANNTSYPHESSGAAFAATVQRCMASMHQGMDAALSGPPGSADAAFVAAMIAHHQGAIDMSLAELRFGHNEQLRRLSQEIVVTQQQEIQVMRLALGQQIDTAAGCSGLLADRFIGRSPAGTGHGADYPSRSRLCC